MPVGFLSPDATSFIEVDNQCSVLFINMPSKQEYLLYEILSFQGTSQK